MSLTSWFITLYFYYYLSFRQLCHAKWNSFVTSAEESEGRLTQQYLSRETQKGVHLLRRHVFWCHFVFGDNNMVTWRYVAIQNALLKQQNLSLAAQQT